jgi:tRNA(Arg) A34 adenosine deaminase TadA
MNQPEEKYMQMAIEEAIKSKNAGEYAVGAVIVKDNEIIARAGVHLNKEQDATSHAEMNAIREACKKLNSKKLKGCILYTTHEPCPMCAGASVWAQMEAIVYGATIGDMNEDRTKSGNRKANDLPAALVLAHGEPHVEIIGPFMREKCVALFSM